MTLADWITRLTNQVELSHSLRLDLVDFSVAVVSNRQPLIARLGEYFRPFAARPRDAAPPHAQIIAVESPAISLPLQFAAKPPDPGKARVKEEFVDVAGGRVVRKRLTGMHFLFGEDRHLAIGPCEANDNQVINFVNNRYIQHRLLRGDLLCHAAGVACQERGLALAGFAGQGKSTLALHTIGLGNDYVSNDRLLIREAAAGVEMRGVPKLPRINPGTVLHNPALAPVMTAAERAAVASLPPAELWALEQKYDVDVERCFGPGRCRLAVSMNGLVMLNWRRAGGPLQIRRVEPARRIDLVDAFRKSAGLFVDAELAGQGEAPAERYVELLSRVPMFEFAGGADFAAAAAACDRFLRTGRMDLP